MVEGIWIANLIALGFVVGVMVGAWAHGRKVAEKGDRGYPMLLVGQHLYWVNRADAPCARCDGDRVRERAKLRPWFNAQDPELATLAHRELGGYGTNAVIRGARLALAWKARCDRPMQT